MRGGSGASFIVHVFPFTPVTRRPLRTAAAKSMGRYTVPATFGGLMLTVSTRASEQLTAVTRPSPADGRRREGGPRYCNYSLDPRGRFFKNSDISTRFRIRCASVVTHAECRPRKTKIRAAWLCAWRTRNCETPDCRRGLAVRARSASFWSL